MHPYGRASLAALSVTLAGCSLVASLDELSSGDDPRNTMGVDVHAAAEATPGGRDAGVGTGEGDAVHPVDAADRPAHDGAVPFCESIDASFCEDWDEPDMLARWTVIGGENASHGVDGNASTTPPSSLFATTQAIGASQIATSYRRISFDDATTTNLTAAFSLRVDERGQGGLVAFELRLRDVGGYDYGVQLVLKEDGTAVEELKVGAKNSYAGHSMPAALPVGAWTRVGLVLERTGAAHRVKVTLDEVPVFDEALTLWNGVDAGKPHVQLGAVYLSGPSSPWAIRMDDVELHFDR